MKVSELSGVQLSYWTAKAEGVDALLSTYPNGDQNVSFYDDEEGCVRGCHYARDWRYCGPLIEKYDLVVGKMRSWHAIDRSQGARGDYWIDAGTSDGMQGATPQEAICRAVVQSVFGDEVPE